MFAEVVEGGARSCVRWGLQGAARASPERPALGAEFQAAEDGRGGMAEEFRDVRDVGLPYFGLVGEGRCGA